MRLVLALLWLSFLCWAMLSPGTTFPEVDLFDFQDKAVHWGVFTLQAYLWSGVGIQPKEARISQKRIWTNFLIFGIGVGVVLEYSQQFVPFRSYEIMDMIVNMIGAISGLGLYLKWPSIKMILE
ncbi:MAG: VanZ family protein [Cyclobacteriaceae bacterium]|nr:VanZ family protein [Cyclobacteriaceae bacterium]MDX5466395.1 VanZ family protein [Cyclobacteriaceae bacterium]